MKLFKAVLPFALITVVLSACGGEHSLQTMEETVDSMPNHEIVTEGSEDMVTDQITETDTEEVTDSETEEITEPETEPEEVETESSTSQVILSDNDFVRVTDFIPDIVVDLKYASNDNFTGTVIYNFTDAYLRYGTVKKLAKVQDELRSMGMGLKIWDAFRPVSAQFRLWNICPDSTYVANPNTGYSSHSRGNTVDITLVYSGGTDAEMPTGFDDFTGKADRDYSDCDKVPSDNAKLLEELMTEYGFTPYYEEWWHFSDSVYYDVESSFDPSAS